MSLESLAPSESEARLLGVELSPATPSLDLHGMARNEAIDAVDKFLNHQFMHGADRGAKIVCGKGKGILLGAVKEALETHPLVERFKPSSKPGKENVVYYVLLGERE